MIDMSRCSVFHPSYNCYAGLGNGVSLYFDPDGYIYHHKECEPVPLNKHTLLSGGFDDYQSVETRKGESMGILWWEMVSDPCTQVPFRVKGIRLHQIHWLERHRWKILLYQRDVIFPQRSTIYKRLVRAGGCDYINEHDTWVRVKVSGDGLSYSSTNKADPENPLHLELGRLWHAADMRSRYWISALRRSDVVLNKVMRESLPKTEGRWGACTVKINGRDYLWKRKEHYWTPDVWPDPTLLEVDLGWGLDED